MSDDAPAEEGGERTPPTPPVAPPPPVYPPPVYPPPVYPPPVYPPPGVLPPAPPAYPTVPPPSPPLAGRFRAAVSGPVDSLGRPMAEWWRRLVAFALDLAILAVPNSILVSVIAGRATSTVGTNVASMGPRVWESVGVALVLSLGYFSFLDGSRGGQTVGKMAIGVAVRDAETGGPIGAGRALARRFFFFATYLGFGVLFVVNALSPLWDPRRRAWHDKVVGSCVVSVR